jgi:hypothetical protein
LEIRYTAPAETTRNIRLEYPSFSEEAAVQKVYLAVYLPHEYAVLGTDGPWSEEFSWDLDDWGRWHPRAKMSEQELLGWVFGGGGSAAPTDAFPTDGQMHLYSTLRPLEPEEGALQVRTMKSTWLHGLMFALVVLGGVLLFPARTAARSLAVGALVIVLVLCGVFLPTFSRQVLNGVLGAAILVVVLLWLMEYLRHRPPRPPLPVSPPSPAPPPTPPEVPLQSPAASAIEQPSSGQPAPGSKGEGGSDHA